MGDAPVVGKKREVVVRILFTQGTSDGRNGGRLVRVSKLDPWTIAEETMTDQVVSLLLTSAVAVPEAGRSDDKIWDGKAYTGTAIDDTWRSAIGMGGGKPWGGSKRQ